MEYSGARSIVIRKYARDPNRQLGRYRAAFGGGNLYYLAEYAREGITGEVFPYGTPLGAIPVPFVPLTRRFNQTHAKHFYFVAGSDDQTNAVAGGSI
jgi:hypothetical protein